MASAPVNIENTPKIEKVVNILVNETDDKDGKDPMIMVVTDKGEAKSLTLIDCQSQDQFDDKLNDYIKSVGLQDQNQLFLLIQEFAKADVYHTSVKFVIHIWINKEPSQQLPKVIFNKKMTHIFGYVIQEFMEEIENARSGGLHYDMPILDVENVCYILNYVQIYINNLYDDTFIMRDCAKLYDNSQHYK